MSGEANTYGIVMLFDQGTRATAIKLSARFDGIAGSGVVKPFLLYSSNGEGQPHMSHLHLKLDEAGVAACEQKLDRITATTRPFGGSFGSIRVRSGTWLFWLAPRTPELNALHARIITECAPLRCGDVTISWAMNDGQQATHRRYGYPSCGLMFDPHITLHVLEPGHDDFTREVFQEYRATGLALAEMGPHGRIERLVHVAYFRD